ncbi:hypothetical protein M409DRAFT_23286 [Zasmidium cellare ATCC 36951]|uniref:Rho-GAP domain-containing protein n=1 Tax=Zasmidium cellare ATCC 36951 TaxID=1080233 RepID=A0A6A6CHP1_ZASCE|nr:uncharacterized protein M409DRAFT_23286 [Zasmidium cellare ATCC 36951]KAF2166655.1 hypothetical protein M409DRAFT_23286 [Zasmidium cellare ATCC 36951]
MPRHSKPSELALQNGNGPQNGVQPGPNSSPMNLQGVDLGSFGGGFEHDVAAGLTPLPAQPQSSPGSPRSAAHNRDPSKNFLSNFKSRISPEQEQKQKKDSRQGSHEDDECRPGTSSMSKIYHLRKNPGSTPELSLVGSQDNVHKDTTDANEKPPLPGPRPQPTPHHSEDSTTSGKRKDNSKPFRIGITRSKSIRRDSDSKTRPKTNGKDSFEQQAPPNTAPLQSDWPGSESRMLGKNQEKDKRGKSAERAPASDSQENLARPGRDHKPNAFKAGGKNALSKARTGGGNLLNRLGKIGRSTSSNEKEIPDHEYQFKVINQPLVEQTRMTRISKELSGCRDKTEYWMPALPWRCIDFLNSNCEQEGLYRVPGSGFHVKTWQRRFDTELDIDLLSTEVLDPNEIASVLKAWLRELPTEIMPQSLQRELAIEMEKVNPKFKNVGESAPQVLRDALSDLPPFNYYLLFAITCHLSLLLTNKDKNKMDLHNLAVCVQPCLYLDRWLFNYLVGDWRHCWQGCYTEKEYLKVEERVEAGLDPEVHSESELGDERSLSSTAWATTIDDGRSEAVSVDDRAISSGTGSTASKPTTSSRDNAENFQSDSKKPMNYMAPGAKVYSNGAVGLGINEEPKRPRTADQRNAPEEGMKGGQTKSRSNSTTPKVGHNRSRSDLPATPVKTHANADWSNPVRPS